MLIVGGISQCVARISKVLMKLANRLIKPINKVLYVSRIQRNLLSVGCNSH